MLHVMHVPVKHTVSSSPDFEYSSLVILIPNSNSYKHILSYLSHPPKHTMADPSSKTWQEPLEPRKKEAKVGIDNNEASTLEPSEPKTKHRRPFKSVWPFANAIPLGFADTYTDSLMTRWGAKGRLGRIRCFFSIFLWFSSASLWCMV